MVKVTVNKDQSISILKDSIVISLTKEEFEDTIKTYNKALTKEQLRILEAERIESTGILAEKEICIS